MNNNQTEFLAVAGTSQNAAQSNAQLDNPGTCVKTTVERPPRVKTVSAFDMSVKGAWRARRDLYRSLCRTPKGRISFEAAELYEDVLDLFIGNTDRVQNFRKSENSYYWGRPIAKWAKKYGCTLDQFDGWLKILRDSGLIATCMMKTRTNMLQIRPLVAAGSACLSGWPDEQNYAHLLKAQTQAQQGPAGSFGPHAPAAKQPQCFGGNLAPPKDLGLAVGLACKGLKDFVDASLSTEAIPDNSKTKPGKTSQTQNQPAFPDAVVKPPKFCTASEKNSAGLLWLSLVTQYAPEHALPLKVRDWKIMRDLCNRLDGMTDLPGHEPVLRWIIRHWSRWATSIGYADQVAPDKLTTVLVVAVAAYHKERQRLAEKVAYKAEIQASLAKHAAEMEASKAEKAAAPPPPKKLNDIAQLVADKAAAKAAQQATTPMAEPALPIPEPIECLPVVQVAKATDAVDYDDEGYTYQETLDAMKHAAALESKKAAPVQPNIFPHKPKPVTV